MFLSLESLKKNVGIIDTYDHLVSGINLFITQEATKIEYKKQDMSLFLELHGFPLDSAEQVSVTHEGLRNLLEEYSSLGISTKQNLENIDAFVKRREGYADEYNAAKKTLDDNISIENMDSLLNIVENTKEKLMDSKSRVLEDRYTLFHPTQKYSLADAGVWSGNELNELNNVLAVFGMPFVGKYVDVDGKNVINPFYVLNDCEVGVKKEEVSFIDVKDRWVWYIGQSISKCASIVSAGASAIAYGLDSPKTAISFLLASAAFGGASYLAKRVVNEVKYGDLFVEASDVLTKKLDEYVSLAKRGASQNIDVISV